MTPRRNRRAGVEDLWFRTIRVENGEKRVETKLHGSGMRWRARYVDHAGRERTKRFAVKPHAEAWLRNITVELETGTYVDPDRSGVLFGLVAEQWFATKQGRAPKTAAGYRSLLDTQVLPHWKAVPLKDIHFEDVQEWVTALGTSGRRRGDGGLSASRTIQAFQVLHWVIKFAIKAKRLTLDPCDGVELPGKDAPEKRFLTHDQLVALADASGHFQTMVLVLGYTGIRFGEAAALRMKNVDLAQRRIRVTRSAGYVQGLAIVEGPVKNHQNRSVAIGATLAGLLGADLEGRKPDDLVFPSRKGGYLPLGELRWAFDQAAARAGLIGLVPHELRHTAASLAIQSGANVKVIQQMLGHKTATMTLDLYGHLFADDLDSVADALDAAYSLRTQTRTAGPPALRIVR
jgi:integrase